jgi:hypothetical protein
MYAINFFYEIERLMMLQIFSILGKEGRRKMICAGKSMEIRSIGIQYEDEREEFRR